VVEGDVAVVQPQTLAAEVAVEESEHPTLTAEVQVPVDTQEPIPPLQAVGLGTDISEAPIESDPAALVAADEAEVKIVLADEEHTTESPLKGEVNQPVAQNASEEVDGTDEGEHVPIEAPVSIQEEEIQIQVEPPAPTEEVADLAEEILPAVVNEPNEMDDVGDAIKSESVGSGTGESEAPLANGQGVAQPAPSSEASEPEVSIIEEDITEAEPSEDAEPTVAPQKTELAAPVDVGLTQTAEPMDTPFVVPGDAGPVPTTEETQFTGEVEDSTVLAGAPAIDPESVKPVAEVGESDPVPSGEPGVVNTPSAVDSALVAEPQILPDAEAMPVVVPVNDQTPSTETENPELAPAELDIDGSSVDVGAFPVKSEVELVEVTGEASESVTEEAESAVPLGEESKPDHSLEPRTEDVGNEQVRPNAAPAQVVAEAPAEETVMEPEHAIIPGAALGEDQPVVPSVETSLAPAALVEVESSQVSVILVIFNNLILNIVLLQQLLEPATLPSVETHPEENEQDAEPPSLSNDPEVAGLEALVEDIAKPRVQDTIESEPLVQDETEETEQLTSAVIDHERSHTAAESAPTTEPTVGVESIVKGRLHHCLVIHLYKHYLRQTRLGILRSVLPLPMCQKMSPT